MTTRNRELAALLDASGNASVGGNLTVSGTTTTISSSVQTMADNLIELNTGASSNSNDLGLVMERGSTGNNAIFLWDESNDGFAVGTTTATGTATGNISFTAAPFTASTITGTVLTGSTSVKTPLIEYTDGDDAITIADGGHITTGGNLSIGGSNNELRFYEGSNYVGFEAPALSANKIWVLPAADGSANQILKTDGSGTLSFTDDLTLAAATVNNYTGNGSATGFTLSTTPNLETSIQAYIDGVYQFKNTFSFSGTTFTFDTAPVTGALIEILVWNTVAVNVPAAQSVVPSTLNPSMITGQAEVTAADADHILIYDASATALKKALVSDLLQTNEEIQDIIGAMFSSNTETGIAATYQDGDGTVDLVIGDDTIVSSMLDTNIAIAGTLGVSGVLTGASLDISGDIDVDGTTNLDVVDIDGAVNMATTLLVTGNVDFNGELDVDGTTNLDVVDIDGAVNMASTLSLGGDISMNDNQIIFNNNSQAILIKDAAGTASYVFYQDNADTLIVGNGTNVEAIRFDTGGNEGALTIDTSGNSTFGGTVTATGTLTITGSPATIVNTTNGQNIDIKTTSSNSLVHALKIHSGGLVEVKTQLGITSNTPVLTFIESDQSNKQYQIGSFGSAYAINDASNSQFRYILDTNGNHIFNEGGANCDFRVETDGKTHMLSLDGEFNRVNIGSAGLGTHGKSLTVGDDDATAWITSGGSNTHLTITPNGASGALIVRTGGTNGQPNTTTEKFRVTPAGHVGINGTAPAGQLHVFGNDTTAVDTLQKSYDNARIRFDSYSNSSTGLSMGGTAGTNIPYIQGSYNQGTSNPIVLQPFGDKVMIGGGGTQPSTLLTLFGGGANNSDNAPIIRFQKKSGGAVDDGQIIGGLDFQVNDDGVASGAQNTRAKILAVSQNSSSGARLEFWTANTNANPVEAMRIIADGSLVINGSQVQGVASASFARGSNGMTFDSNASPNAGNGHEFQTFRRNSTQIGSIVMNGTGNITYGTSSDYRLKENVVSLENGLDKVQKLNPVQFNWKDTGETNEGFLAHEVQEICKEAVSGEKDGEKMQGVDYGRITPLLVKAIQELTDKVKELESKLEDK